ncbi:MAG: hypothetical protein IPG97_00305 [Microthrixaceae bacterium]|nr:hypothetical protein [Microthrixaceae bacterium]
MTVRGRSTRRFQAIVALLVVGLALVGCGSDDGGSEKTATTATSATSNVTGASGGSAVANAMGPVGEGWQKVLAPASCRCSDGTPFHYWVRPANPEKVLFFLNGGGACFSAATCSAEGATYTVNLDDDEGPNGDGIFDLDNEANPLADYSMVAVPYCTGDLHLGTRLNDYGNGVEVHHNGYANGSAALAAAAALFPKATEVVVAGSSAGSAGAPAYAGAASDVWPDADIAVIADASAAYPGTPAITLAIGALWGTEGSIPLWPETADLPTEAWSLPGLFVNSAKHDPDLRFATYNNAFDEVQAGFSAMIGQDAANLVGLIDANNTWITEQGVDIRHWVAPGTDHTVLVSGELYDQKVGGESLIEWITDFIEGKPGHDVHCTDCEPPA